MRNNASLAIREAHKLVVGVEMMTGDAASIEEGVLTEVSLGTNIVDADISSDEGKKSPILGADDCSVVF